MLHGIDVAINVDFVDDPMTPSLTRTLLTLQEAKLSQRDRATPYVSWNLVKCCATVREIALPKLACIRGTGLWRSSGSPEIRHVSNNVDTLYTVSDTLPLLSAIMTECVCVCVCVCAWPWNALQLRYDGHIHRPHTFSDSYETFSDPACTYFVPPLG